jgi:hypothetical protein
MFSSDFQGIVEPAQAEEALIKGQVRGLAFFPFRRLCRVGVARGDVGVAAARGQIQQASIHKKAKAGLGTGMVVGRESYWKLKLSACSTSRCL